MNSVLFINRVYPPDDGATGQLLAELAEALAREGWRVTVLAAGTAERETRNSQPEIHRVRGLPFTRASLVRRALSYASLYPALLWRAWRLPRHDVIVTLTDPPLLLTLGPILKRWKRPRLIHWAQDVYPEVAEELGVLRQGGLAACILRGISTWALGRHDHIVAVGRCMEERLRSRGISAGKISVMPNWAVGFGTSSCPQPSTRGPQPPPPFTVLYSGNFGLAHPFESIIAAVQSLDRASAPVRFVFAGTGPRLKSLRESLASCRNAEFRAPAPLEKLAESLAAPDVHLACMSEDLAGLVVPSKVYGALAAARPCIFLGPENCEVARLLTESGRGRTLAPDGSGPALAALLTQWAARGPDYSAVRSNCERQAREMAEVPVKAFLSALDGARR